jgi:hypothetical protein
MSWKKHLLLRRRFNIKTTIQLLVCFTGIFALLAAKKRFAYIKVFCKRVSAYFFALRTTIVRISGYPGSFLVLFYIAKKHVTILEVRRSSFVG